MKLTKRISVIVMALMMLALMMPFAAYAADETYSLKVTSSKEGFAFEIYKVADLDLTTGNYSNAVASVMDAINSGDSQKVLDACDALDSLSGAVASYTTEDKGVKTVDGLTAGIYYIKKTQAPAEVTDVTNRIIPLPYYVDGEWKAYTETIDLATKIAVEPVVSKKILESKETEFYTTAAINENVKFQLKATIPGSVNNKLTYYAINDTIDASLTRVDDSFSVSLQRGDANMTVPQAQYTVTAVSNGKFSIEFDSSLLATDEFYNYTDAVVTYEATLNENAKIGADGNENSDGLTYQTEADTEEKYVPGNTVYVFSLEIDVTKIDASTKETIADKTAKFALLAADKETVITELETVNGVVSFKGIDQGTYYVKETKAPEGYNLNTTLFEVTLDPSFTTAADGVVKMNLGDTDKFQLTVEDTPAKLPTTGGEGTLLFTIIGASLVLIAGALFVVVLRKRTAK